MRFPFTALLPMGGEPVDPRHTQPILRNFYAVRTADVSGLTWDFVVPRTLKCANSDTCSVS